MTTNKLVSVIIPCYNAERWIKEAIDSGLGQSYPCIEIIVIDDGSTDDSLNIIKSYDNQIIYDTGVNRGGNYARNRGFSLSKGQYIQYLDADDYLFPEKLEKQVQFLESSAADGVYGDWQYQYHHSDGRIALDDVKISGHQKDLLASLLSGWWISPACLLFKRQAVESCGGWDESFTAGQDKDFLLSIVMNGAKIEYQPGCYSVYRRYGNITVSTSSKRRYLDNHIRILEKYERQLREENRLTAHYKDAIAQLLFQLARGYIAYDRALYTHYLEKVLLLSPHFHPQKTERTWLYNLLQQIFGFSTIEKLTVAAKDILYKAS